MNLDGLIHSNSLDWLLAKSGDKYAAFDPFGLSGGWFNTPAEAITALDEKKQDRSSFLKRISNRAKLRPHNGRPFKRNTRNHARRRL